MPNNRMERFTARARRVLSLAQETAEDYKHNYIGTEHLLIGLLREEGGIAGRVLRDLGLEQRRVEGLVEELTQAALQSRPTIAELSPGVKRVLELAVDEARRMGHHYIGTEHLLLGLVRQSEGVAIDVLKRLGISPEEVRRQTRRGCRKARCCVPIVRPGPHPYHHRSAPMCPIQKPICWRRR
ncbi:MAG: Clp protease N-terminal domain-containing protein [Anaerolineae bacterium]